MRCAVWRSKVRAVASGDVDAASVDRCAVPSLVPPATYKHVHGIIHVSYHIIMIYNEQNVHQTATYKLNCNDVFSRVNTIHDKNISRITCIHRIVCDVFRKLAFDAYGLCVVAMRLVLDVAAVVPR
jgi:hypothetical protein